MLSSLHRTIHLFLTESTGPRFICAKLHHHVSHLAAAEVNALWRSEADGACRSTSQAKIAKSIRLIRVDATVLWPKFNTLAILATLREGKGQFCWSDTTLECEQAEALFAIDRAKLSSTSVCSQVWVTQRWNQRLPQSKHIISCFNNGRNQN